MHTSSLPFGNHYHKLFLRILSCLLLEGLDIQETHGERGHGNGQLERLLGKSVGFDGGATFIHPQPLPLNMPFREVGVQKKQRHLGWEGGGTPPVSEEKRQTIKLPLFILFCFLFSSFFLFLLLSSLALWLQWLRKLQIFH